MAGAAQMAGLSAALGAFLAGLLLAETEFRHQIETDLEPFKDLLLGLFFVTVGMQIDISLLMSEPVLILIGVAGLFVVKGAIIATLARVFGFAWPRAIQMGLLLGQSGEFAFVVIAAARAGGAIPADTAAYMLIVTASDLRDAIVAGLGARVATHLPRWRWPRRLMQRLNGPCRHRWLRRVGAPGRHLERTRKSRMSARWRRSRGF